MCFCAGGSQGAIDVYQRVYLYAKTDSFTHVYMTTLFAAPSQTRDYLGISIALTGDFLIAGGPGRFTDTDSDTVRLGWGGQLHHSHTVC